jgi:hypothetical protein
VGVTTITWNVSDANGNAAAPVLQTITVNDTEAPAITCPANINTNVTFGETGKVVNYDLPIAVRFRQLRYANPTTDGRPCQRRSIPLGNHDREL